MPGETKHGPEPLNVAHVDPAAPTTVRYGHNTQCCGPGRPFAETLMPEEARRIAILWSACAGIPTEALEAGALGDAIGVLEDIAQGCSCDNHNDSAKDALRALGRLP